MRKLDPKKHPKLIAFLEKTQKILKTVAIICFSLVIVLCVFFYTKACSEKNAAQLINASAEEASTALTSATVDVESGIDSTLYPSANLIPYPYKDGESKTSGGITFTVQSDCSILMNGTASYNSLFYLYQNDLSNLPLEIGKKYTFGTFGKVGQYYAQINYRESGVDKSLVTSLAGYRHYFTLSEDWQLISIYVVVLANTTVENVVFSPMLNVGDVEYPYLPPLDRIYYGGYNEGYTAGETDGKEIGYNDGLEQAAYGMWRGSTVSVSASVSGSSFSWSGTPEYFSEGVGFSSIYEQFKDNTVLTTSAIKTIKLSFATSVRFVKNAFRATALYTPSISQGVTLYAVDDEGIKRVISVTNLDDTGAYVFNIPEGVFTSIQIESTKWNILQQLMFFSYEPYYEQGYEAGYQAGYNNNGAYDDGYKNGYNVGKSDGFQDGFNQSESGGFGWLISSVQQFLSTPFWGNFGPGTLLYVGLGITLTVMFLRMFAGG